MTYLNFIEHKAQSGSMDGFDPVFMPDCLFDFQKSMVEWAVRKGKAALFEDCGLGKTPQQLVWAENVVHKTNKPVLVLTPLAVSHQTVQEAHKFDIEAHRSHEGELRSGINVTNYERLHYFNPDDFAGVVCDESSILKHFDGARKQEITTFMRKIPYRLLATATAAPNDYIELGTSSEALGELGYTDMLTRFFKNDQNTIKPMTYRHHGQNFEKLDDAAKWRFKGHAEQAFWRWVCSWARAIRKPSDLGFKDDRFILPPLDEQEHMVSASSLAPGMLFALPAVGLKDQREERRRTIEERCVKVAELVAGKHNESSLVWCHLNDEGNLLEKLIPNSIQVEGADSAEWKEAAAEWFQGNKCICNDRMFSAKLSAWKNLNGQTQNTCANTTALINQDGRELKPTSIGETLGGANAMRTTRKNVKEKSKSLSNTACDTQRQGSSECSSDMAFLLKNTEGSKKTAAQYAAEKQMLISGDSRDSTSIIAISPENSEEYCARLAISALENSGMTQLGLSEPHCICGHKSGKRVLISKPKIFGWGLNFQHCNHVTFFPSHSFEQYYQGVRRCWRFGQTKPVHVDVVTTEGEQSVLKNLQRKAKQADKMFDSLVEHMNSAVKVERSVKFTKREELPSWL